MSERLKICWIEYTNDLQGFNFKYLYFSNISSVDIHNINSYGNQICKILEKYAPFLEEEIPFTAYLNGKLIALDIDSVITKKSTQKEKQKLADLSAKILRVVVNYLPNN